MELRCPHKLHGTVLREPGFRTEGVLEVRCRSQLCGAAPGVLVLHRFDLTSGELVDTKRYTDPAQPREGGANGAHRSGVPVRSA